MIELSGNFPSSFRDWTYADLGDYDECFNVHLSGEDRNDSLRSHYCLMSFEPNFEKLSSQGLSDDMIREIIPPDFDDRLGQSLKVGLCITQSCTSRDIDSALDSGEYSEV